MLRRLSVALLLTACLEPANSQFGVDTSADDSDAPGLPGDSKPVVDADGDGVPADRDCNDANPLVRPGAAELCNGADDDCDGLVDQSPSPILDDGARVVGPAYRDVDIDGYGVDASATWYCDTLPAGWALAGGDCDDASAARRPGAAELCDGIDNDCDGLVDSRDPDVNVAGTAGAAQGHPDDDGDGFGAPTTRAMCSASDPGFVDDDTDCDDTRGDVYPGALERCDGVDQDCDDEIDEEGIDPFPWFRDADGDGYGSASSGTLVACTRPSGHTREDDDCDDTDPGVHPGAEESCDSAEDANCDGYQGDADPDRDGFPACEDCGEGDPKVYPGAPETWYDGIDQDCAGDDDWDRDGDGHRLPTAPGGGDDCDDGDPDVHPGGTEVALDGIDNDCVGGDSCDTDGDGVCDVDDDCPYDNPDDRDGDGVCDSDDPCPDDLLDDRDGDTICDSEDPCPDVVGPCCGDGACTSAVGENCSTCEEDCGVCCGNGVCNSSFGETCSNCTQDCGACPYCGDGICNGTDSCSTCERDCNCDRTMTFRGADNCNDSAAVTLYAHRRSSAGSCRGSTSRYLLTVGSTYSLDIDCKVGETVCWGATVSNVYWGIGSSCTRSPCSGNTTSCCYSCSTRTVTIGNFNCP
ncbi:MAG: putative metal-binding motif-containing protein [Alphaproteobacteria bacterium]|nr:putative metal-binding motif-containing protein [Alphaproteobacteria bacterium]